MRHENGIPRLLPPGFDRGPDSNPIVFPAPPGSAWRPQGYRTSISVENPAAFVMSLMPSVFRHLRRPQELPPERELVLPAALERLIRPGSRAAAQIEKSGKQPPALPLRPERAELAGNRRTRWGFEPLPRPVALRAPALGEGLAGASEPKFGRRWRQRTIKCPDRYTVKKGSYQYPEELLAAVRSH